MIHLFRSGTKLQTEVIQTNTCCPPLQTPTQGFNPWETIAGSLVESHGCGITLKTMEGAAMSRSSLWGYSDFTESWTKVCKMRDPCNKTLILFSLFQVVHNLRIVLLFLLQSSAQCLPLCLNGRTRKADTGSAHNSYQIPI